MKNTCLLLLLLIIVTVSHAQFQTGKKVIGGQIGIATGYNNYYNPSPGIEDRNTQFSASLSLSRFKSPTLLNGFGFSYGYMHNRNNIGTPADEQNYNAHTIGAFINSTKLVPLVRKLYLSFTGTVGAGYGFSKTDYVNTTSYRKREGYNLTVSGDMGLLYQLNERFLFTATLVNLANLSYSHYTNSNYSGATVSKINSSNFALNSGLTGFSVNNISVGVRYILK